MTDTQELTQGSLTGHLVRLAALVVLAATVGANLVLDFALVAGLGMGIAGARAGKPQRVEGAFRRSFGLLAVLGTLCGVGMIVLAPRAIGLLLDTTEGVAFPAAVQYLRLVALFYPFCFTGNTFTGYYSGTGRVTLPFAGALGHISVRVVLSWLLFARFGLNAVAAATGIGWLLANIFWAVWQKEPAVRR